MKLGGSGGELQAMATFEASLLLPHIGQRLIRLRSHWWRREAVLRTECRSIRKSIVLPGTLLLDNALSSWCLALLIPFNADLATHMHIRDMRAYSQATSKCMALGHDSGHAPQTFTDVFHVQSVFAEEFGIMQQRCFEYWIPKRSTAESNAGL
jgi:hypothetical protein